LQFVVDGEWVTDPTAPQEKDASGNLNNVLTTDRIVKHTPESAGIMSGVAPTSTTAELAKNVPLEKTGSSDLPGTFPETPAAVEKGDFSVAPLPAFDGAINPIKLAPGEKVPDPSSFTNNTVTSGVRDDPELVAAAAKEEQQPEPTFSVAPLPAFPGGVNPVKVAPGEKIPESSTLTGNTIHSAVTTDKESYEKSGGLGNAPVLPPVVTPQSERDQKGTGILDLPPISKKLIPESSLPIGGTGAETFDAGPTIQSSGPASTTAQLAAAVPLESSKVPEVVKESQAEAGVGPEASAVPEEVKEKSAVEKELLGHVPVAPATSEGIAEHPNSVSAPAKDTPEVVKESIAESGQSPEAAANEEAVLEKKAVEKELLSEIKPETSTGEPAPKGTSAGTSGGLNPPASPAKPIESREVSPGTVPGERTPAAMTTTDKTTPAKDTTTSPSTPSKATPGSSKAADSPASVSTADKTDKKKKRLSFFGKLKAKLSDKKN
jgi:hypothetical protein